ncbi:hypothetical protein [Rufibacter roseolus]|uniref:hypothetical protein n=1 Tax=Rufibacter roseolus TaxID=2817375 RepID=UPI001B303373|nr:hypothetical protein [Rufibacter roseolus]
MKLTIFSLALLFLTTTSYGQGQKGRTPAQEYYLQKSKSHRSGGWALSGIGLGLMTTGVVIATSSASLFGSSGDGDGDILFGGILATTGLVSLIGGGISFISAGNNKRKAMSPEFSYTPIPLPQQGTLMNRSVPTLGLKVTF